MKIVFLLMIGLLAWGQPSVQELKTLESDAMVFGNGPNRVYVFIDPLCQNSLNYIDFINSNNALKKENTYYVFLHRLEKFESDELIDAIYMADNPKEILLNSAVLHKEVPWQIASQKVAEIRARISNVASKTGMKRRPYILFSKPNSEVCDVSDGSAPCMDKNDKK